MDTLRSKILAVLEVTVVFLLYRAFFVPWVIPMITQDPLPARVLAYGEMILIAVLVIILSRQRLGDYGITMHNFQYNASVALDAFLPMAVEGALIGWLVPIFIPQAAVRWQGALLFILIEVVLLFVLGRLLRDKPGPPGMPRVTLLLLPLLPLFAAAPGAVNRMIAFLYYLLLVGPGEELFFRGYVQSRLNRVFGCPYHFYGASWGWGAVIASVLFGALHIFNGYNPLTGSVSFSWWWGVWTVFSGLVFAYLREKTGSVVTPAILHGLPQAIAALFFGIFSA